MGSRPSVIPLGVDLPGYFQAGPQCPGGGCNRVFNRISITVAIAFTGEYRQNRITDEIENFTAFGNHGTGRAFEIDIQELDELLARHRVGDCR